MPLSNPKEVHMGDALLLNAAVIDEDKSPDWAAAEQRIAAVTAEEIDDELDVLEPYTLDPEDHRVEPVAGGELEIDIDRLRRDLRGDLQAFRDGVDHQRSDLDYLLVRGARVWVTGGPSYGDDPSDVYPSMRRLHAAGVLAAAGFDGDHDPTAAASPVPTTTAAR
jgi:hypothetical protein